jgi:7-cyano-7-deazaguanine synthase
MHAQLKFLGITAPLHEVPLTTINPGSMCEAAGDPGARVVAARNLIMLAHAVNYAASIGADEVWYGALADDARDYHDCRQEWVRHLNHCTKGDGVAVWSPLISKTKAEVVREAAEHGVLKLAWSCYTPRRGEPCGTCNSCKAVQASIA